MCNVLRLASRIPEPSEKQSGEEQRIFVCFFSVALCWGCSACFYSMSKAGLPFCTYELHQWHLESLLVLELVLLHFDKTLNIHLCVHIFVKKWVPFCLWITFGVRKKTFQGQSRSTNKCFFPQSKFHLSESLKTNCETDFPARITFATMKVDWPFEKEKKHEEMYNLLSFTFSHPYYDCIF